MSDLRYRVNPQDVMSETIDGMVVIVHLGTGTYYGLEGTAAAIWQSLATGASVADVLERIRACFKTDGVDVDATLLSFVGELVSERLLILRDCAPGELAPQAPLAAAGTQFVAPVLDRYTDLQQIIMLDPVHDVDPEAGWPTAKKPADDSAGA